jgi:PEGA domain
MFRKLLFTVPIVLAGVLTLVPPASAARGFVVVGGGFYGPYGYGWAGPGWYGPGLYGPYAYWGPYGVAPYAGQVKIKTNDKNAAVFVDGGYAGLAAKLKKFWLRPGTHNIELRDPSGHAFYQERVEVIPGKTLEIHADYRA